MDKKKKIVLEHKLSMIEDISADLLVQSSELHEIVQEMSKQLSIIKRG